MTQPRKTYAIEVFQFPTHPDAAKEDLVELESLIETVGYQLVGSEIYLLRNLDLHTLLGKGKLQDLKEQFENQGIDLIILDFAVKPYMLKNIEDIFNIEVMDRTRLILEIFKRRATSSEGKLQVELAEAKYELGRLSGGRGIEMSRLGGGVGTRGPGEQKGETDRRGYVRKIKILKDKLDHVNQNRMQQYKQRRRGNFPLVSFVGYTNAGKSSLLNALTKAGIRAQDELFSTVDPTTRKLFIVDTVFLLSDTVGVIKKLPTELVQGFESTLEQVTLADIVLLVVDCSDPLFDQKESHVRDLLKKLHVQSPILTLYNKVDALPEGTAVPTPDENHIYVSAVTRDGLDKLRERMYVMGTGKEFPEYAKQGFVAP